jgi:hypothetical protein
MDTITRRLLWGWMVYFIFMTGTIHAQIPNLLAEVVVSPANHNESPIRKKNKRRQRAKHRKKKRLERQQQQFRPFHHRQIQDEKWNRDYMHGIGFLGLLFSIPALTLGVILTINLFRIGILHVILTTSNVLFLGILGGVLVVIGLLALYFLISAFIRMKKMFPAKKKVDFFFLVGIMSSLIAVLLFFALPFIFSMLLLTTSLLIAIVFSAIGIWLASILGIHFSQLNMRERLKK